MIKTDGRLSGSLHTKHHRVWSIHGLLVAGAAVADQPNMGSTGASTAVSGYPEAGAGEHKRVSKTFRQYLPSCHRTYSCVHCRAHLANHDELISKSFQVSWRHEWGEYVQLNIKC